MVESVEDTFGRNIGGDVIAAKEGGGGKGEGGRGGGVFR